MNAVDWFPVLAVENERLSIVIKGLAIVGAGVLGGFGTGAVTQGAAKLISGARVPAVPLQLIRALSALATGWIVFLLVAGPGGSGLGGGGGGLLPGNGDGSASTSEKASASSPSSPASSASRDREAIGIDVHVLEPALVRKKLGAEGVEKKKYFRLEGSETLLSQSELESELIRLRKEEMPRLKHVTLLPQGDSASDSSPLITGLKQWGDDERITFDTSRLGASRGSP